MSLLPTGKSFGRLAGFPLDPTCVYESDAGAVAYASTSPLAYAGQIIAVTEPPTLYMIRVDRSLLPLVGGTVEGTSVLSEPMFPIGYITWIVDGTDMPDSWVPSDTSFSPIKYPLLAALLGMTRTPVIPHHDGMVGIMFGRYVETVKIPDDSYLKASGPNHELEKQLIVASNAMVAQMTFEDGQRLRMIDAVGSPCLASDDFSMLFVRLRFLTHKFQNVLMNQGVTKTGTLKFDALIDRVDRLVTAESMFRLTLFESDLSNFLLEKNANVTLPGLTLSWNYNDDSLLKTQLLTGPGSASIEAQTRSQHVVPGIKDTDLEYVLTATDTSNRIVSRSLRIEYVYPAYYGCTPFFNIDGTAVKSGTKILELESERLVDFTPVHGYMFFAIPETWHPYKSATDSHGFDFLAGSLRVLTVPVTTPDGTVVPYRVYASRVCNTLDRYTLHFQY